MKRKNPTVIAHVVIGETFLNGPDPLSLVKAINKVNCKKFFDLNADRVEHFKRRIKELGYKDTDMVIVLINVDDVKGGSIADILMPGFNWQEIRDRGQTPVARGLVDRIGIQGILATFDVEACEKLKGMDELAVVVIDNEVAEVFPA